MQRDAVVSDDEALGRPPDLATLHNQVARQQLQVALFGETPEPVRIDRFALVRELGQGGMGTVWMAEDAELDRTVALKFLRAAGGEEAEQRLQGEAQSLAKISHPNVVPVFDVGRHEGRVWVAMELVAGRTLRTWVAEAQPSRRARLEAWLQAGHGLAAVHAAGLVHRDIKPENVLRGEDGRVRVIDFGLVRRADEADGADHQDVEDEARDADGADEGDEGRRSFAGTPAYAAPEQLLGEHVDARADQFSFACAVFEALTGKRPDRWKLPARPGALVRAEAGPRLPRRIQRALSRALCEDPSHRFDSMESLLEALTPRRGRRLALAVAGTGVAGLAIGLYAAPGALPEPCEQATRALDSHWDDATRDALAQDRPELAQALDAWSDRWRAAAQQTCEDVHVEQLQPPSSLSPRRACLDARLDELGALLTANEARAPERPVPAQWLAALDEPRACLSPALLRADAGEPPDDQREAVSRIRTGLVAARWGLDGKNLQDRRARVAALYDEAQGLGFAPLLGSAARARGQLATLAGATAQAEHYLGEALDLGQQHDPLLVADAWLSLQELALDQALDPQRARWLGERAERQIESLDDAGGRVAMAALHRGRVYMLQGQLERATPELERAVEGFAAHSTTAAWKQAAAIRQLAIAVEESGDAARALRLVAQAAELERGLGEGRRPVHEGEARFNEAEALRTAGRTGEAEMAYLDALDLLAAEYGAGSPDVANAHVALSAYYDDTGDKTAARRHAELADALLTRIDAAHPDRMYSLSALATTAFRDDRFEEAAAAYERVLAVAQRRLPPGSTDLAWSRVNLAEAYVKLERASEAEVLLRRALAALRAALGEEHAELAIPSKALGEVALAQGKVDESLQWLQGALAVSDGEASNVVERAEIQWLLAKAHAKAGHDQDAQIHAAAAQGAFEALGDDWSSRAEEIRAWRDR